MIKKLIVLYELHLLEMIAVECFAAAGPVLTTEQSAKELLQIFHQNIPNNSFMQLLVIYLP